MANPMTAAQQLQSFKKWDIKYQEYRDWEVHNRNSKGHWGPVYGLMAHHTGSDSTDQRELLYKGNSSLPGPLSQYGISQDGTLHLIGNGRANHAGLGDPDVLNAVKWEDYGKYPPTDNQATVDGNTHFYGVEIWYSGSHSMTDAQYFTLLRLGAAIFDFHNWTHKSLIAHGEWQPGKWDPGFKSGQMMDMHIVRTDLAATIKRGPVVIDPVESKSTVFKQVWETDAAEPPKGHKTTENPTWHPMSLLRKACEDAEAARKNTEKIMKHLGIS